MAGGPSTVDLVSAATNAGALGQIAGAYLAADEIKSEALRVRAQVTRPFGINLFVPQEITPVTKDAYARALEKTRGLRQSLSLSDPKLQPPYAIDFDQQFEAVLEAKPNVFSFVFGRLAPEYTRAAQARGILVIGAATTTDEARALEDSGVDAIVAQGVEAGGHRAVFDAGATDPGIRTIDLLEALRGRLRRPLIAAGGLMVKDDVRRALRGGAVAVQMGTAFLATREAGTTSAYRRRLRRPGPRRTELTRAFSGRPGRSLINAFTEIMKNHPEAILPYPAQNAFTRDIRRASAAADRDDALSLWCGTGEGELFTGSAVDLIHILFES